MTTAQNQASTVATDHLERQRNLEAQTSEEVLGIGAVTVDTALALSGLAQGAREALEAVLELHSMTAPDELDIFRQPEDRDRCRDCRQPKPCDTRRAIAAAIEGGQP